jgi:integrase
MEFRWQRDVIRRLHYSIRTEQTYVDWIRRFILFHRKRHPAEMGATEVETFLTHLAVQGKVAASTQNQALNAILFLYRQVLEKEQGWLEGVERAKKPARLAAVFTRQAARAVLSRLDGIRWVMASLLYGSGLRLMECLRLRVKDVDFDQHQLIVRDGKGGKDRITMLPDRLVEPLRRIWTRSPCSTRRISRRGSAPCTCPSHWRRSIRTRTENGGDSMYFPPHIAPSIRAPKSSGAITSTPRYCSGR